MSHDVAAGGKHYAANVAALGRGANDVNLRRVMG
jgi:hypothetical protein